MLKSELPTFCHLSMGSGTIWMMSWEPPGRGARVSRRSRSTSARARAHLQLDAVGDALEEGGLAHGDVALHAEGQVAPRPPAPALLRALARRLHRQQVVHDQPRVPARQGPRARMHA
eukprot:scaffold3254_cov273-Prasinococcus_capsulatus_cf.AAC.6